MVRKHARPKVEGVPRLDLGLRRNDGFSIAVDHAQRKRSVSLVQQSCRSALFLPEKFNQTTAILRRNRWNRNTADSSTLTSSSGVASSGRWST